MSVKVLKQYINEVLRVTVQRVETGEGGEKEKASYTKSFDISDDDADELDWFLDNYGKPPLNMKKKSQKDPETGKTKYIKVYDDVSELQIAEVIKELEDIAAKFEQPLDKGLLAQVIRPWGDQGFKALKYILVYSRRTGKAFPFFMLRDQAKAGGTFDLGTLSVSKNLLNHLLNVTPRIGKNDTGQEEFLIALLAGGIAGGTGLYGDVEIGTDNWEVKAPSSNGVVRLGDLSSGVFRKKLKELVTAAAGTQGLESVDEILDMASTRESYVNKVQANYPQIADVIKQATDLMLQEMKITGFALVFTDQNLVKFVSNSSEEWEFYNAGGKSSGRIHIKLV